MAPHLGAGQHSLPSRSDRSGIQGERSCRNQDEQLQVGGGRHEDAGWCAWSAKEEELASLRGGQRGKGGGHDCCDEPWRFILTCLRRLNLSPLPYKTQKVELKQNTRELPAHPHLSFTTQARNCCASPADAALGRQLQTGAARNACTSCRRCSQCEQGAKVRWRQQSAQIDPQSRNCRPQITIPATASGRRSLR